MKRFFVILASFLFVLALTFPVLAQDKSKENFRQGELVTLPAGETVNRDFFAFGERVEISGTVNGDVYAGGGIVIVDGKVNGDLLAGGGTLTISGSVSQDARVGGGQITITGKVGRNLTIGGGNVELTDPAAKVGGEVTRNTPAEGFRPAPSKIWGIPTGAGLFFKIISIISTVIIGLLVILLFPRFSQKVADNIAK